MSRCPAKNDPDIIHASYKTCSNRSTRLLLLEIVAEAFLKEHQELKNFMSGFGPKKQCECSVCDKARVALRLKNERG